MGQKEQNGSSMNATLMRLLVSTIVQTCKEYQPAFIATKTEYMSGPPSLYT
jgi:hypothetical protein